MKNTHLAAIFAALLLAASRSHAQSSDPIKCDETTPTSATDQCVTVGTGAKAATASTAIGDAAIAGSISSVAIGTGSRADGSTGSGKGAAIAIGNYAQADGGGSLALGSWSFSTNGGLALGWQARAAGDQGTMAMGTAASATAAGGIAIGANSSVSSASGVAIGVGSVADGAGLGSAAYLVGGIATAEVSFGSPYITRRLSGVAAGAADTDAANVQQVKAAVATAKDYTDTKVAQVADAAAGAALDAAKDYADAGDARTLDSARSYADAGDARTLDSARSYTDATAMQTLNNANTYTDSQVGQLRGYVDDRFYQTDKHIARIGAISSAAMQAATNTAGLSGANRVGVGVGFQGGERALSIGYQRIVRRNFSVSLGGGFAGNDRQAGVGAGFSW